MAYHFPEPQILPRRSLAVGGIIALHLMVVYVLVTGMIQSGRPAEPPPIAAKFLPVPPPEPTPLAPVTESNLHPARVAVELPPVRPVTPPEVIAVPVVPEPNLTPLSQDLSPPLEPLRIVGRNLLPDSEDFYPADRRRLGIEGATSVRVCVDARGLRQGEPVLEQSSGDAELDNGALNVARHGHYARALQGTLPVPNCYRFHIVFKTSLR